jgi:hypothetical protein
MPAPSNVAVNIAATVSGLEELARLTNRVDALERAVARYRSASSATAAASQKVAEAFEGQSKAARRAQLGAQQLGLQINDLATSISTGQNPLIALNQQLGQIGFAMMQMQGRTASVGAFLSGPWGAAIAVAATTLFTLYRNMSEASDKAQTLSQKLEGIKFASDLSSTAQDILGRVMDTTTGKMRAQSAEAINLARAQLMVAKVQAQVRAQEARAILERAARRRTTVGIGLTDTVDPMFPAYKLKRRPTVSAVEASRALSGEAEAALKNLDRLLKARKISADIYAEVASAIANYGLELKNVAEAEKALNALNTQTPYRGAATDAGGGGRAARAARAVREQREEMSELDKAIARLTEKYKPHLNAIDVAREAYERGAISLSDYIRELTELSKLGPEFWTPPKIPDKWNEMMKEVNESLARKAEELIEPQRRWLEAQSDAIKAIGRSVSQAFMDMLTGARSWKDGMRGIIQAVIAQLWELYVVQQIVGLIGKIAKVTVTGVAPIRPRAAGGPVQGGSPYLVGEKGPELMVPGRSGTIVSNDRLIRMSSRGNAGTIINVDARGATDPALVRAEVRRGIIEAAPAIIAASESWTIRSLRRPRLAGGPA